MLEDFKGSKVSILAVHDTLEFNIGFMNESTLIEERRPLIIPADTRLGRIAYWIFSFGEEHYDPGDIWRLPII